MNKLVLPNLAKKDIVFIGRGQDGLSFERFIKRFKIPIKSFRFVDQKDDPNYLESLTKLDPNTTTVVKTPGCPGRLVPVDYTTPAIIFFNAVKQLTKAKIIGLTGTKGKSTSSALLYECLLDAGLKVDYGGNNKTSMLDLLELDQPDLDYIVLELSSYQLAELNTPPDISLITNLFLDHTDYHGSLADYWEAKRNIVRNTSTGNLVVYDQNFDLIGEWLQNSEARIIAVDTSKTAELPKSKLIGRHNQTNYLLVEALTTALGLSVEETRKTYQNFKPIPHRLEYVKTANGIVYIDDAIASQPEAAIAGIEACLAEYGHVGCVMLGGQDRSYDFGPLGDKLLEHNVNAIVLFPNTQQKIIDALPANYKPLILQTDSMEQAVAWAAKNTPKNSVCLLSTAAPSYSLWKNFEQKGCEFQQAISNL